MTNAPAAARIIIGNYTPVANDDESLLDFEPLTSPADIDDDNDAVLLAKAILQLTSPTNPRRFVLASGKSGLEIWTPKPQYPKK